MTDKSLQFAKHCNISNPPHVRNWGKPNVFPNSSLASLVSLFNTSSSVSSARSLIFLHPKPAWSSILFSVVVGVFFAKRDERHTNCTVHVLCGHEFFLFFPLPELALLTPAVLFAWNKRLLSCLTESLPLKVVPEAAAFPSSSSDCPWLETYFVQSSLSPIRSSIMFTPRSVKALSDIYNATPGSILSFEKLSERVPKLNWCKIESITEPLH